MQIQLYRRTFAVAGSPVSLSFIPDHPGQKHTFSLNGTVYAATQRPLSVIVPEDSKVDELRRVLRWKGNSSTAQEVFDYATAKDLGFRLAKA